MIDLLFLDQSGFAPTLPTGYTWGRRGRRVVVPYEAPQGRRVNVVGALTPYDPVGPRLVFETRRKADGRYDAAAHLAFVRRVADLPPDPIATTRRARPCVVVLDNYSVHHSQAVKDAIPALAAADVHFCYLPPYSPELNPIEPVWRQVKYQDLPERSHPTDTALQTAVETALTSRASRLAESTNQLPRRA
jgi:DDE superfamily endonuclease